MLPEQKIEAMITYGVAFIGGPYKYGGDDPMAGFDCSGFVQELLLSVGWGPPTDHSAQDLFHFLSGKNWSEKLQRGAIVFFGKNREKIGHVAIALNDEMMLEAGGGDATTTTLPEAIKRNAFIRIRPIKHRKDLIAYLYPVS
jgi:cell wall-associated NlpC family hydrolase